MHMGCEDYILTETEMVTSHECEDVVVTRLLNMAERLSDVVPFDNIMLEPELFNSLLDRAYDLHSIFFFNEG